MSDYVKGSKREQVILLPDRLDDYVDENNPVRFIDAFVDSLDLVKLGFKHAEPNEEGRPPYNPGDMLKLYIWGYLNQIRSSRKLERECHRDFEVVWLMRRLAPDFKTISNFRKNNIDCIKPVFKEFICLCKSLDLFGAELVGIDSSKFRAVNSTDRNFNREKLLYRLKCVEEAIERYLGEMEENDEKEASSGGEAVNNNKERMKYLTERLKQLTEMKNKYEGLKARIEATGEKEISLTDPDSRCMKNNGKLEVCYNIQTATDSRHKLIADYDVTNNSGDQNMLSDMAKSAKETLEVERLDATADRGYQDAFEILNCVQNGITPYVPESSPVRGNMKKEGIPAPEFFTNRFTYDKATDTYTCPAGQILKLWYKDAKCDGKIGALYKTDGACFSCPHYTTRCSRNKHGRVIERWEHEEVLKEMRARLNSLDGRRKVRLRSELCEHPFGTIKRSFNQGYLLLKGLRNVRGEIGFTMLAYDMRRAINILGVKALIASVRQ